MVLNSPEKKKDELKLKTFEPTWETTAYVPRKEP
jgi:hypothetical protein